MDHFIPPDHFINQITGRTKPHSKNKAILAVTWPSGEDSGSALKYDRKAVVLFSPSIHITLRANLTGYRMSMVALWGQN